MEQATAGRLAVLKRALAIGVVGIAVPALVACGGGGGTAGGGGPSGGGNTVTMTNDNKFVPDSITVPKGTTITWNNTSSVQHTVTFDPSKASNPSDVSLPAGVQPFDSGFVDPKKTFTHTFDTPGTYKYTCVPHEGQGMHGTVIVQ